jgi:hypothetical protein
MSISVEHGISNGNGNKEDLCVLDAQLRDVLRSDVERRVTEKVEELWKQGHQKMMQANQKHEDVVDRLVLEVSKCQERHEKLELENVQLKEHLASLVERFSFVSSVFAATPTTPNPPRVAEGGDTSAGSTSVGSSSASASASSPLMGPLGLTPEQQHFSPTPQCGVFPKNTMTTSLFADLPCFPYSLPQPQPAVAHAATVSHSSQSTPAPQQQSTPLLLAEVLGHGTASSSPAAAKPSGGSQAVPPTPLSLASSLEQPSCSALAASGPPEVDPSQFHGLAMEEFLGVLTLFSLLSEGVVTELDQFTCLPNLSNRS